jgi:hypothetical protein
MAPSIAHLAPWLSQGRGVGHSSSSTPSTGNITNQPDLPWNLVGDAETHLLQELKKLYWMGVKSDLEAILFTLKKWQQPEYASVVLDDEKDGFIHGFDTFIDQVCQESRAFATRYGMPALSIILL